MEQSVVEYNVTDAAIAEMESIYMGLSIDDLENKEQFDSVHSARMVVKGKRVEVEKRRKELKVDALAWSKKVDSEAKRIFGKLEPIETHLQDEENKVINEQKRIKAAADEAERKMVQKRVDDLFSFNVVVSIFDAASLTDAEYVDALEHAQAAYNAEQDRKAKEDAERKAENYRLEKIRFGQEAAQAKIDAADKRLAAERAALETEKKAEQDRKDREAFEVQARAIAESEARITVEREAMEAKEKADREEREAQERAAAEEAERVRQESLRPDKEKLGVFAKTLMDLSGPTLTDINAQECLIWALREIQRIAYQVQAEAEMLGLSLGGDRMARDSAACYAAAWSDEECPECGHKYVARDRFGRYCGNSKCGWVEGGKKPDLTVRREDNKDNDEK